MLFGSQSQRLKLAGLYNNYSQTQQSQTCLSTNGDCIYKVRILKSFSQFILYTDLLDITILPFYRKFLLLVSPTIFLKKLLCN